MSIFNTPADSSQITQSNEGEVFGDFIETFNIDLVSNRGKIRGSRKLVRSTDEDDNNDLEQVAGFKRFNNQTYALSDALFELSNQNDITSSWTEIAGESFDGNKDDIEVFNSLLLLSKATGNGAGSNDIVSYDGSFDSDWYTNVIGGSFTNDVPHPMEVATIGSPLLCIGDGNRLNTVTEGGTPTDGRLTLREDQHIKWIRSGRSSVWIGCINTEGGEAFIYEWDGGNDLTTRAYKAGAQGALACEIWNDTPIVMTSDGAVRQLTGNGFEVVAFLPVYKSNFTTGTPQVNNVDFINPNGIGQLKNEIYFAIESDVSVDQTKAYKSMMAGIWALNPQTGSFTHKYSPVHTTDDFGTIRVDGAGALLLTKTETETTLLASFATYPGSAEGSDKWAIFYEDLEDNFSHKSHFITPEIYTSNVTEHWQNMIHQVSKITGDSKIVVKYRTQKQDTVEIDLTWSNVTDFTTTDDISDVEVGDEVCIVQGAQAGQCAHVFAKSGNTITLDDAIGTGSGTAVAEISNFKKFKTINSDSFQSEATNIPSPASVFIQYKVYLDGTGDSPELNKIITSTEANQPA